MAGEPVEGSRGTATVVAVDDAHLHEALGILRWRLHEVLPDDSPTLVVDVSGVESLSSATVAALLLAKRSCRARGGRVVLRGLSRRSVDVLTRTGLRSLFDLEQEPPSRALSRLRPGERRHPRQDPPPAQEDR